MLEDFGLIFSNICFCVNDIERSFLNYFNKYICKIWFVVFFNVVVIIYDVIIVWVMLYKISYICSLFIKGKYEIVIVMRK